MKSLLGYFGGKSGPVGAWIAQQLPPHRVYVEPFGGMAGILMQKRPSPVEVYNDLSEDLVNLFTVVREQPQQLRDLLNLTPYARKEHKRSVKGRAEEGLSDLERARRTYTALSQARDGAFSSSWSHGGPNYNGAVADAFRNGLERIPAVCERLSRVQLDCQPWGRVVAQWDSPKTLTYLDPPYTENERSSLRKYSHELKPADHEELMHWCLQAKGMVLLSGYRNQLYADELEGNGWLRRDFATIAHSSAAQKKRGTRSARVESLWLNPAAAGASRTLFCTDFNALQ